MTPIAIVLNGASSSGKSSIARALQEVWPTPLIHASLDTFTDVFHWRAIEDEARRNQCHGFAVNSFHDYLAHVARSNFAVVVDHVFDQHRWYESTREALKARPAYFVAVRCELDILEDRERKRGNRVIGLSRWQHERVHEGKTYDLEVNTGDQTPDECAVRILSAVRETRTIHE